MEYLYYWTDFPFGKSLKSLDHQILDEKYRQNILDFNLKFSSTHDYFHLIFILFGYISIILYHTRHQVPIYQQKFHKKRIYLYVHIFTGITEVCRYRLREKSHGHSNILPSTLDILSCFIWSWTSLELVKTLRRGDPRTTRPPYQAGAILRPVVSLASYLLHIPSLHRVSISALDSFIYARLAIFFFCYTPYIQSYRSSTIYAISIPLAAAISIHESRVPGASVIFILATAYIARLNEWVTRQSRFLRESEDSSKVSTHWRTLISTLVRVGFAELEELQAVASLKELERPVNDEYVPVPFREMKQRKDK